MRAQIIAPQQISPAPCCVRNVSQGGATLEVKQGWVLPRSFWLRIQGDPTLRFCTAAWRDALKLGVAFTENAEGWEREWTDELGPPRYKERRSF